MNNYKELSYFKRWTLENYPFIEADFDAITEYQLYCKIVEYLNKCIYNIKLMETAIDDVEKQVADLKAYVDEYLTDMSDVKEEIEAIKNSISVLTNAILEVNTKVDQVDNKVANLKDYTDDLVNSNFNVLKSYVDAQDEHLQEEIDNINIGALIIYDPTTGTYSPVQTVINNLYSLTNKDGITASEFDTLELTATEFDSKQLTAYEFDSSAKILLTE